MTSLNCTLTYGYDNKFYVLCILPELNFKNHLELDHSFMATTQSKLPSSPAGTADVASCSPPSSPTRNQRDLGEQVSSHLLGQAFPYWPRKCAPPARPPHLSSLFSHTTCFACQYALLPATLAGIQAHQGRDLCWILLTLVSIVPKAVPGKYQVIPGSKSVTNVSECNHGRVVAPHCASLGG